MSIFSKALDEIKYTIPRQVLTEAFKDTTNNWRQAPVSLDEQIMNKVIKPRVLLDANLIGGQETLVSLEGLASLYIDTYTVVFEIPAERLNFREIMSVLSIGYLPYSATYSSFGSGVGVVNPNSLNDVLSAGQRVGNAMSSIPVVSNATAELIGYNTVMIRDQVRATNAYQLRCVLANDANLNNINLRSYPDFAKLCQLAVRSYIYNTLLIKIDNAYLQGGQELGSFKNYVESLADSEEMYQTYLREVWGAVAFMNDVTSYERFIKLQISPGL